MRKYMMWSMIAALLALLGLPLTAGATEGFFGVDICQLPGANDYRATFLTDSIAPIQAGYAIVGQHNEIPDHIIGVGTLRAGRSITIIIDLPEDGALRHMQTYQRVDNVWQPHYIVRVLRPGMMASCAVAEKALAGCDMFMPIDTTSRMVTFVASTFLLWHPADWASTGCIVKRGQTAWMIGDQDGYAEIVWSCGILWVPLAVVTQ